MNKRTNAKYLIKVISVLILTLLFSCSFFFDIAGPPLHPWGVDWAHAEDNIFTDKVGIGTTAPSTILHVRSAAPKLFIQDTGNSGPRLEFAANDGASTVGIGSNVWKSAALELFTGGFTATNERMTILSNGNIGIGTTSPVYNLEVASTGYFGGDLKLGTGTFNNASGASDLYVTGNLEVDGSTWLGDAGADSLTVTGTLSATNASMTLKTLTVNESAYLAATSGNVGIGTTVPSNKLDVAGDIGIGANKIKTTNLLLKELDANRLTIRNAADTAYRNLHVQDLVIDQRLEALQSPTYVRSQNADNAYMIFEARDNGVGPVEVGRLQGAADPYFQIGSLTALYSGNVGIGTTGPGGYGEKATIYKSGINTVFSDGTRALAVWTYSGAGPYVGLGTRSAHDLSLMAGDSVKAVITTGGNVGIGTTAPSGALHINKAGAASEVYISGDITQTASLWLKQGTEGAWGMYQPANSDDLRFYRGSDLVTLNSSGNVGIGTTSPGDLLEVRGSTKHIRIANDAETEAGIVFVDAQDAPNQYARIWFDSNGGAPNNLFNFYVDSATPAMTLKNGNVGIGTTNPGSYKLYVNGDTYIGGVTVTNGSLSFGGALNMQNNLITNIGDANTDFVTGGGLNLAGNLAVNTDKLFVNASTGNVGIGTTAPNYKLHVSGSSTALGVGTAGSASGRITLLSSGTGETAPYIETNSSSDLALEAPSGWITYNIGTGLGHLFRVNGNEKVRIDGSGNLGIGTTNPKAQLHIEKSSVDTSQIRMTENNLGSLSLQVFSADNAQIGFDYDILAGTEYARDTSFARIIKNADTLRFSGRGSQSVDSAISGSDTLTVALDILTGNVGIGTTAPGAKLHVNSSTGDAAQIKITAPSGTSYTAANVLFETPNTARGGGFFVSNSASNWYTGTGYGTDKFVINRKASATYDESTAALANALITIDTGGNVGIGTTNPGTYKLYVNGDTYIGGVTVTNGNLNFGGTLDMQNNLITNIGSANTDFTSGGGLNLAGNLAVNSDKLFVNASTGNVGIGTTAPNYPLHVYGTGTNIVKIQTTGANDAGLYVDGNTAGSGIPGLVLQDGSTDKAYVLLERATGPRMANASRNDLIIYTGSTNNIVFGTNTAERMRISSSGNVGIGTTAPETILHVRGTEGTAGLLLKVDNVSASEKDFGIYSYNSEAIGLVSSGNLKFHTNEAVDTGSVPGNVRMTIDTNGNVGIGTTGPDVKLHVLAGANGSVKLNAAGTTTGNTVSLVLDPTATAGNYAPTQIRAIRNSGDNSAIAFMPRVSGATTEVMRVDSSGNVGIGATVPSKKLFVKPATNDTIAVGAAINNNEYTGIHLGYSASSDILKSAIFFERTTDYARGNLHFVVDGAADNNNADLTDVDMTITSSGNVGIGTTNPGSYKLYVNGDTYIGGVTVTNGNLNFGGSLDMQNNLITNIGNANTDFVTGGGLNLAGNLAVNTDKLFVNATTGNVGIGTTNLQSLLTLGTSNPLISVDTSDGSDNKYLALAGAGATGSERGAYIAMSGNERGVNAGRLELYSGSSGNIILGQGNVGIGTTAPSSLLHVNGIGRISGNLVLDKNSGLEIDFSSTTDKPTFQFRRQSDPAVAFQTYSPTGQQSRLEITTGATAEVDIKLANLDLNGNNIYSSSGNLNLNDQVYISGNVGIGTTGPSTLLTTQRASSGSGLNEQIRLRNTYNAVGGNEPAIIFDNGLATQGWYLSAGVAGPNPDQFRIGQWDGSPAATPEFVVTNTGNVGIGTTNPGRKLDVNGDANIGTTLYADTVQLTGSCCGTGMNFNNENAIGLNAITISDSGANEGLSWADAPWSIDNSPLDRSNAVGNLNLYSNQYNIAFWRPTLWVYNASNYATATVQSSGGLDFTTTGVGHITFNQGGNVGIGTTAPGDRLHVYGYNQGQGIKIGPITGRTEYLQFYTADTASTILHNEGGGDATAGWGRIDFQTDAAANASNPDRGGFRFKRSDGTIFMQIANTGNVGIGTTNPGSYKLYVNGDTYIGGVTVTNGNLNFGGSLDMQNNLITNIGNANTDFISGGGLNLAGNLAVNADKLYVNASSGNVGIGTTAPGRKLHVSGSSYFDGDLRLRNLAGTDATITTEGDDNMVLNANVDIVFKTNSGDRMIIKNPSGNVGIGTTNPAQKLQVAGNVDVSSLSNYYSINNRSDLGMFGNGSYSLYLAAPEGIVINLDSNANGTGTNFHITRDVTGAVSTNALFSVVEASGNVGIGNASPGYKLDVNGTARIVDQLEITKSDASIVINSNNPEIDMNGVGADWQFGTGWSAADSSNGFYFYSSLAGAKTVTLPGAGGIWVETGNVGIGTTAPLQSIGGGGSYSGWLGTHVKKDNYGIMLIEAGERARLQLTDSNAAVDQKNFAIDVINGKLEFNTVNDALTSSDPKMVILTGGNVGMGYSDPGVTKLAINGNVGIGTTNPGSYKLYVNGDTYIGGVTVTNGNLNFGGSLDMQNNLITNIGNANTDFTSGGGLVIAGNVGIGTASITSGVKLDVEGSAVIGAANAFVSGSALTVDGRLAIRGIGADFAASPSANEWFLGDTTASTQRFYIGNTLERLSITGTGNVGIGTTGPTSKLDVNGAIEVADGSSSAPSFTFGSDTTTGIYKATDLVAFTAGNLFIGQFSGVQDDPQLEMASGKETRPAYSFASDTNADTGMWRGGENIIAFSTDRYERMRIDAAGNVGIGTTNPSQTLEVNGTTRFGNWSSWGGQGTITWDGGKASTFNILGTSGKGVSIGSNGVYDRLYMDTSGNVGIGTTNPGSYKLYVNGDTYIGGVTVTNGNLNFGGSLDMQNNLITNIGNAGTDFTSGGGLTLAGNLVVSGTTTLGDATGDTVLMKGYYLDNDSGAFNVRSTAAGGNLYLKSNGAGVVYINNDTGTGGVSIAAGGGDVTFPGSGVWKSGGNVGIGTVNPTLGKLQVDGIIFANGNELQTNSRIRLGSGGDLSTTALYKSDDTNTGINWPAADTFGLVTAGNYRLYIKSDGNVGIGTTGPGANLDIRKQYDTGDAFKISFSDPNVYSLGIYPYVVGAGNVGYKFRTTNIGTTIDAMAITGAGNVGIGTTNPGSYKLYVNGDTYIGGVTVTNGSLSFGGALNMNSQRIYNIGSSNSGFDAAGNLGIGTGSPATKIEAIGDWPTIQVRGSSGTQNATFKAITPADGNVAFLALQRNGGTYQSYWEVRTPESSTDLGIYTNASPAGDRVRIKTDGNVGIGTVGPNAKLQLVGGSQFRFGNDGDSGTNSIYLRGGTTGDKAQITLNHYGYKSWVISAGDAGNGKFSITGTAGGSDGIVMDTNSNVGIGTTSPGSKLNVYGTSGNLVRIGQTGDTLDIDAWGSLSDSASEVYINDDLHIQGIDGWNGAGDDAILKFGDANHELVGLWGAGMRIVSGASGTFEPVMFADAGGNEKMRIHSTGSVGIGTTAPQGRLQLVSQDTGTSLEFFTSSYDGAKNWGTRMYKLDIGGGIPLIIETQQASTWLESARLSHGQDNKHPSLQTGYRTFLAITGGSVGIGTTNPLQKLQVAGDINIESGYGIRINNTATSGQYLRGNGTQFVSAAIAAGDLPSSIDAAKIANGTISNTEFQYLDNLSSNIQTQLNGKLSASGTLTGLVQSTLAGVNYFNGGGNVGIGTTSPGALLDVQGGLQVGGGNLDIMSTATDNFNIRTNTNTPNPNFTIGIGNGAGGWSHTAIAWNNYMDLNGSGVSPMQGGSTSHIRILSGGNVGIGTTNPQAALDVGGNFKVTSAGAVTGASGNISMWTNNSGYITASSTDTLTNKSGNISMWTNNSGYITSSGSITGDAGTLLREDNRTISPSELTAGRLKFGFTSWANNDSSPYADFLHLRSYTDSSGGSDNLVMFKKSGIGMRIWQQTYGSATAYATYKDVAFSGDNLSIFNNDSGYITASSTNTLTNKTWNGVSIGTGYTAAKDTTDDSWSGTGDISMTSGNVGIGTASPVSKLEVANSSAGSFTEVLKLFNSDATSQASSVGLNFATGYVGETAPLAKIRGYVGQPANNGGAIDFITRNGNGGSYTTVMTLFDNSDGTGKVGIGTTGPLSKLHIHGNYSNDGTGGFALDATDTSDQEKYILRINPYVVGAGMVGYIFQTKSSTGGTQIPLVFNNAGNVGIGTTGPGSLLDVNGDIKVRLGSNGNTNIWFTNAAAAQLAAIEVQPSGAFLLTRNSDTSGFLFRTGASAGNAPLSITGGGNVWLGGTAASTSPVVAIQSGGNVGIGTTNPGYKLDIQGGDVRVGAISPGHASGSPDLFVQGNLEIDATAYLDGPLVIAASGLTTTGNINTTKTTGYNYFMSSVGIGTTAPGQRLDIIGGNGRVETGYSWLIGSDIRFKKNITTLGDSLNKVMDIRGVRFDLIADKESGQRDGRHIGFVAQELENEFPELVVSDQRGMKAVDYDKMTAVLVEAVKEQQRQIANLRSEMDQLRAESRIR